jgi:hypothetical protein
MNINDLQHKVVEIFFIFKIEFNIVMLYFITCLIIVIIGIILLRIKNKNVKMYEPEIAENHSLKEDDKNI